MLFFKVSYNVLAHGAVADLEANNCHPELIPNRINTLDLTTSYAIEPKAC